MELRVFQSEKGDCLLLTSADDRRMLVDGGVARAYSTFVAPHLATLAAAGEALDVVCVSHIDDDHIGGVLRMMDDAVAWRVHAFQVQSGNTGHRAPTSPEPPEVRAVWHNAFHEVIGKNAGEIEETLAASAAILSGHSAPGVQAAASSQRELATSTAQGLRLSRRIGAGQLNIPLNGPARGKLMMVRDKPTPLRLGKLRISVIGPFASDLTQLRKEWNDWLRENKDAVAKIKREAKRDEEAFEAGESDRLIGPMLAQARAFGDRKAVTTPNLASLMLLVREVDGGSILLTGDGHADDILKGLDHHGELASGGRHVNVLKVQHHGSEFNWTRDFGRAITADDYVFCANGAHENPDFEVVEAVLESRLGNAKQRGANAQVGNPFRLWFNASERADTAKKNQQHMAEVSALIRRWQGRHQGKMSAKFLKGDSFVLTV